MAEVMEMLALSPTMEEGTLVEWLKKEGDTVEEGELLAEVETDKATMEMESFFGGTILKLLVEAGATVKVGDPLAIIGKPGEDISSLVGGEAAAAAPAAEAPKAEAASEPAPKETAAAPAAKTVAQEAGDGRLKASPLARRMAEDAGIALENITGSGPQGRIVKSDVEQAMASPAPSVSAQRSAAASSELAAGDVKRSEICLTQMRKTIARRLAQVWQSTPHFFLTMDIDMGPAMAQRKLINEQIAAAGGDWKVSVNDMIIKACANALANFPQMNVGYENEQLFQFEEVNIGVAVAIEDGLITPTIRNADAKSLGAIAREARELAIRAREKKLRPEEYSSHTFSISNLGMYDIDEFTAVLNAPDAGILACGAVKQVPVVKDGELTVGTRMKITLSCDHRAVDGAVGASFLKEVRSLLENPILMMV